MAIPIQKARTRSVIGDQDNTEGATAKVDPLCYAHAPLEGYQTLTHWSRMNACALSFRPNSVT